MTSLVFVDTETTGLYPERHEIWEVAAVKFDILEYDGSLVNRQEFLWQLPVDESKADLIALNIGKYFDRRWDYKKQTNTCKFADIFQHLTLNSHLVGAIPSFDEERLRKLLLMHRRIPAWHYHLICVENLAAGALALQPPWKSDEIFKKLGIERNEEKKHTAMGDVEICIEVYKKVMNVKTL